MSGGSAWLFVLLPPLLFHNTTQGSRRHRTEAAVSLAA